MSKNHVKQPIPMPKQPLPQAATQPAGTKGVTIEQAAKMFDTPAVMINNFQILPSESYIRMAFAEHDTAGVSHIRGVVAFDFKTLVIMGRMIEAVLQQYVLANSKSAEQPKESDSDNKPAENAGQEPTSKIDEKTPSDNS